MIAYTPSGTSGEFDRWTGVPIGQPATPSAVRTGVADAAYFGIQVENNLLAAINASVASPFYRKTFGCVSGLTTGQPVYLSDADTVALAAASGSGTAKVVGFVRDKTSGDTGCYIAHYWLATGLTCTTGATLYLSNAGAPSTAVGTYPKVLGIGLSTTGAWLEAGPLDATLAPSPMGGAPETVGGTADSGSGSLVAKADHRHALLFSGNPTGVGGTASSGTLSVAARLDHVHALTFSGNPTGVGTGTADSGTLAVAARADHVHAMRTGFCEHNVDMFAVKSGGSSDPTLETIGSGTTSLKAWKFDSGNEVFFGFELPHTYKHGTDISCHLSWMGTGTTGGTVVWQLDVQAVAPDGVWTFSGTGDKTFTGSGTQTTGGRMQEVSFGTLTGTTYTMDTIFLGRLSRQGGTTTSSVYALELGFIYQMDSFGSLTATSKT